MTIRFGTDGWRGIIAEDFTFENVRLCAQGTSLYLAERGLTQRGLVVGYDTRFASERFAQAVAEVAAGNGVTTLLCQQPAPTPVVSYNIVARKAGGAAIITASHNPAAWNGFKYKPEYAGSASPEVVARLEAHIDAAAGLPVKSIPWERALATGIGVAVDSAHHYLEHIGTLVDLEVIKSAGLKVHSDAMYGAGAGYFPTLLSGGKTTLQEIHAERNPLFPGMDQPEPVAHNLSALSRAVVDGRSDVGLALDGDADRFGLVDEHGEFITPLQVFALLVLYLLETKGQRGPLVKSMTATSMIYRLGELYNVPVLETPVGFKYIGPVMQREDALIGGEESGGFGFKGHIPERDGVLSGLFLLDLMVKTGKRPSQLLEHLYSLVGPHFYRREDVQFPADERQSLVERMTTAKPDALGGKKVTRRDPIEEDGQTTGVRFNLEDGSWAMVRFSGTEPLLRFYAEASSQDRVTSLLEEARNLTGA